MPLKNKRWPGEQNTGPAATPAHPNVSKSKAITDA
jgi:hypothetical protein